MQIKSQNQELNTTELDYCIWNLIGYIMHQSSWGWWLIGSGERGREQEVCLLKSVVCCCRSQRSAAVWATLTCRLMMICFKTVEFWQRTKRENTVTMWTGLLWSGWNMWLKWFQWTWRTESREEILITVICYWTEFTSHISFWGNIQKCHVVSSNWKWLKFFIDSNFVRMTGQRQELRRTNRRGTDITVNHLQTSGF